VGGIWPSITTGCWPSRHGFYSDRELTAGTYEARKAGPWEIEQTRVWETISATGGRCAVLDAPLTTPSAGLNGVQLVEWGSHDRFVPTSSSPAEFAHEVIEQFGMFPVQPQCDGYAHDLRSLRDALLAGVEAHTQVAMSLLDREPWDFFMAVFGESHCAGHHFWRVHDPEHPQHDAALRAELGDVLLEIYEALDGALARLLEHVPADGTVAVVMSHGIGPHYDGNHMLSELLRRLDDVDARRPLLVAREGLGRRFTRAVRPPRAGMSLDSARRFFMVPNNDLYGGIRINLKGREPRGRVSVGAEYDEVVAQLSADLLELENVETGTAVVDQVLRTAELYDGPLLHTLPDLLVDWHRSAPIVGVRSGKLGTLLWGSLAERSGDHRPGGLVVVRAPGVAPGQLHDPVPVVDLAPTFAAHLGVSMHDVDGCPLPGLLPSTFGV
jgi:predicted AlkP superfamily phosphohydrolase/phosphomutase